MSQPHTPGTSPRQQVPPAITVTGLHVVLGHRKVLDNINLTIKRGSFTGILGPNGAGKTTLLRSIIGTTPVTGKVAVDGAVGAKRAARIGYVPQRHNIDWNYPIDVATAVFTGRTGGMGWRLFAGKGDWAAVGTALDKVGISHLANRPIGQLSGGQRQRVLLARALAKNPSVLLLDEPCTGLDMPGEHELLLTCRSLAEHGTTVVMTTHDIGGATDICDRLVLINRSLRAHARPAELMYPEIWMDTFGIGPDHHLLRTAGVVATGATGRHASGNTTRSLGC
ncbi:anchored repeat-type ABC transporter ATP-binding subunit [Corynebacterium mendelii]|uniref:Anchored repeat-type ABC transporter ATP-binding subunit n=1 Tax=Corynebacterium mendelii TaxID=2765362 RepID=A0A939E3Z8_9CORY|nr:anchored repeat-type ABC transporter ATP-binding subunit [Corynebacterium mendelii]MBN9645002.1 anchored repeat-type ABC transporter ATP-binding subunit [Corynebacterium mendelii]